eukprot:10279358-Lingulodinium_polyedra.AAC.1
MRRGSSGALALASEYALGRLGARTPATGTAGATNNSGKPRTSSRRCSAATARTRSARSNPTKTSELLD